MPLDSGEVIEKNTYEEGTININDNVHTYSDDLNLNSGSDNLVI